MSDVSAGGDHRFVQVDDRLIEALQEREQHLAEEQRLAQLGIWEWDIAKDRVRWSDELYRIFGLETQAQRSVHSQTAEDSMHHRGFQGRRRTGGCSLFPAASPRRVRSRRESSGSTG